MKKIILVVCVLSTVLFAFLIIIRITTKSNTRIAAPSPHQLEIITNMVNAFDEVKTQSLSLENFNQAVHARAGTNLNSLTVAESEKLFACLSRFYACYSSGGFDAYKELRLYPPFAVNKNLSLAAKKNAGSNGVNLNTDEDILHFAWDQYNGTNKIGEVNENSIHLTVVARHDLGEDLRHPAIATNWPEINTAMCWEGAVTYQPTPADILKTNGSLRFFSLEISVRFYPLQDGPISPLVFLCYWDPTRENWMPLTLCSMLQVHTYDTIF